MRWADVLHDPTLQDLPYKIELDREGNIVMSPASNRHGRIQVAVAFAIKRRLKRGTIVTECSVETGEGVKVADVAWVSDKFIARHGEVTPYPVAPEICVEVISPSNSRMQMRAKADLYLARGAQEVWMVDENEKITYWSAEGQLEKSRLVKGMKTPA